MTIYNFTHWKSIVMLSILLLMPGVTYAKCGGVDYSWGVGALQNAHDFTVTMMLYIVYLASAIAGIVAIIGALQIYIKMNTGEGDIVKSIMMLFGACLFLIGAFILFPAFFGYNIV